MKTKAHAHLYAQHLTWQTHLYCTVCGFAIVKNPRLKIAVAKEYVGYSKSPSGAVYLIGVGPLVWLQARVHEGCELSYREVTEDDQEAPYYHERDLSGAEVRGDK